MTRRWLIPMTILMLPSFCYASYMCNNNAIVHEGDTTLEVQAKCGPATNVQVVGEVKMRGKYVNVERWLYNPGKGKLYHALEFQDGILVQIKSGTY